MNTPVLSTHISPFSARRRIYYIKLIASPAVEFHRNRIPIDWLMRHKTGTRYIRIIKYSTGIALYSFPRRSFIPIESYDFPPIISFDSRIRMIFRSLIESHYDSPVFNRMISTSVPSTDIGVTFLVFLHITFLATIICNFRFIGFIFLRDFSHRVSVSYWTSTFADYCR